MMELKHELIQAYRVDYKDLEQFIEKCYPDIVRNEKRQHFSIPMVEECANHVFLELNTSYKWNEDDEEIWEDMIKEGKPGAYTLEIVLCKLCIDRHINPGRYIINVNW